MDLNARIAPENALSGIIDEPMSIEVVQTTGQSTTAVMSQKAVTDNLNLKENLSNKVTSVSSSSTDAQYPSAKCVYGEVNGIKEDLVELEDKLIDASFQYLMQKNRTNGYYYNISGNNVVKGGGGTSGAYIFEPITLKANVTYYYSNLYGYFTILDNGSSLSRLSNGQEALTSGSITPTNDTTIYISVNGTISGQRYLIDNTLKPRQNVEGFYNTKSKIDDFVHIIVKQDGTGDYLEPISAVRNITDSSKNKQYLIEIYEGTYTLYPHITSAERQGTRWGLKLPNYVHLKGIGNVDNIILDCSITNPTSTSEVEYTSCLNLEQNNNLENITFKGSNIRYVVHDESSNVYKDWKRIVKNCKFIHTGNATGYWIYTDAWGEGCSSGSVSEFYDCYFQNNSYTPPYAFHTNTSFEKPCYHKFVNCTFESMYTDISTQGTAGVFGINDIQSGKSVFVDFIGCSLNGFVFVQNSNSTEDWEDIHIGGYGNTPIMFNVYRPNVSNPKQFVPYFSDITKSVKNTNNSTIEKGRPLFYTNFLENTVGILQENGVRCCGIALEDMPPHSTGQMQFAGYLQAGLVGLSVTYGTKLGVNGWAVTTTDANHFAYVPANGLIKFL